MDRLLLQDVAGRLLAGGLLLHEQPGRMLGLEGQPLLLQPLGRRQPRGLGGLGGLARSELPVGRQRPRRLGRCCLGLRLLPAYQCLLSRSPLVSGTPLGLPGLVLGGEPGRRRLARTLPLLGRVLLSVGRGQLGGVPLVLGCGCRRLLGLGLRGRLLGGLLCREATCRGLLRRGAYAGEHPVGLDDGPQLLALGVGERSGRLRQRCATQGQAVPQRPLLRQLELGAALGPLLALHRPALGLGPLAQEGLVLRGGLAGPLLLPRVVLGDLARRRRLTERRVQVLPGVGPAATGLGPRDPTLLVRHAPLAELGAASPDDVT